MPNVGIIIATKDRPQFVDRLLNYYSSVGSPHTLYIGDGTQNITSKETILRAINRTKNLLSIKYYELPELNAGGTHKWLADRVDEDYCCYHGDDDLLVPNSLSRCAEFLDENRSYSSAQGRGIIFEIDEDKSFGKVKNVGRYWDQPAATASTPEDRLLDFSVNYWASQFSVKRTREYVESFSSLDPALETYWFEIIHQCLLIFKGKSQFIDCLYICRQIHASRHNYAGWVGPKHVLGWITRENWLDSYKMFEEIFVEEVYLSTRFGREESKEFVREIFYRYLAAEFIRTNANYRKQISPTSILAGHSPLTDFISRAKRRLYHQSPKLSLPALLRGSSPYFDDFRRVYECLTR